MSEYRIKKVGVKGKKIRIKYEREIPSGDPDEFSLLSQDEARPEFHQALKALVPFVLEICEASWDADTVEVTGVSFSHVTDVMGAVITAQKRLAKAKTPLNINTPHQTEAPYGGGEDESNCLPEDVVKLLKRVEREALRYIKGMRSRSQLSLLEPNISEDDDTEIEAAV